LEQVIPHDTVVVCALGHDLCKVAHYEKGTVDGALVYTVRDNLPLGHGEKSLSVLQQFIGLTDLEKMAIRWHMGAFDMSVHFNNRECFREAVERTPLVPLLIAADYEASAILERNTLSEQPVPQSWQCLEEVSNHGPRNDRSRTGRGGRGNAAAVSGL
ncbi:MAG: hypothetical protein NUW23_02490, partial [Firmicutes bacterium]|nr:hypothetical protein [Bacillota bacterium]